MKPQLVLSQFAVPHMWKVFNIYGQLLFDYDPIQHMIVLKKNGTVYHVRLNQITEKKFVRDFDNRIMFEYDPNNEKIIHKEGRIITDVFVSELRKKYHSMLNEVETVRIS